jgi:hypothetical protein
MKTILSIALFFSLTLSFGRAFSHPDNSVKKPEKLLAMIDSSDSGTSMTLEKANKNAEAAKNNRSRFFPVFFSPLLIVIIVIAAKRRKKRNEGNKN